MKQVSLRLGSQNGLLLSIPLRMKRVSCPDGGRYRKKRLSIPLRMKQKEEGYTYIPLHLTFNSFEDETSGGWVRWPRTRLNSTFNSFEDETTSQGGTNPNQDINHFQFLWGWNNILCHRLTTYTTTLSIPLRMKLSSVSLLYAQESRINFQFLWGWNSCIWKYYRL